MKIFKSIKWKLQIWYGLMLSLTIAAGIATSWQMERERQFAGVDRDLHVEFQILMNILHLPPPRRFDEPPPEDQPPDRRDSTPNFRLPNEAINSFFQNISLSGYYSAIWLPDGSQLMQSTNAPRNLMLPVGFTQQPRPIVQRDGFNQELIASIHVGPANYVVIIGRSITPELKAIQQYVLKQLASALIVLIAGLAIGTWLISRALRPIQEISSTAVKISAGDLSQRISVAETESELGQLAAVLNSTFARLESAFAQQKQFASDAAHELRTPVSVILTQTQTALNRERSAEDYKQTVEACQRAAQRMRKLISALLELARLDAGQEILKRLRLDFSKTISDCVELVKPIADERGVKIFTEISSLEISGDSERLAQVVTNLLTNAIQYNRDEGEVRVNLKSENGLAILEISDTGQGIAPEDLPRVFERFYRADKSRSSGNAGLGLAISKAIVEAHGGTIEVTSEENVGTTFILRLPI